MAQPEDPDNLGGVVVQVSNWDGVNVPKGSLIRVDGASGTVAWRYDSPGTVGGAVAVDQNGYILSVEDYQSSGYSYTQAHLIKIDPVTGAVVASWAWPSSTDSFVADQCGYEPSQMSNSTTTLPGISSLVSVGPDGSYYLEISFANEVDWLVQDPDTISCNLSDEFWDDNTTTITAQLMTVAPSGSVTFTTLPNFPSTSTRLNPPAASIAIGNVIPDGNGGILASLSSQSYDINGANYEETINDIGGSGGTATLSNFFGYGGTVDMVLGDQGSYFACDGYRVVSVNQASGAEQWRWEPSDGTVQIIAATAGGGLAVRNIVYGSGEDVVRLDSTGTPAYDAWGTSGGSLGYGVVSKSTYYSSSLWVGTTSASVLLGITGDYLSPALDVWAWLGGNGPGQSQSSSFDFEIVWCAGSSCARLDPSDPDTRVNFIYYQADPVVNTNPTINLSAAQQAVIQQNALNSLRLAFSGYRVTVGQGRQGTNTVYVVGEYPKVQNGSVPCANTNPLSSSLSRDYYLVNMEQAQWALNAQTNSPTQALLAAIGEGIGNNAAHEIAYQLTNGFSASGKIVGGMGLDDASVDTYNGASCNGETNPWVFTSFNGQQPISWGTYAVQSLTNVLGKKD